MDDATRDRMRALIESRLADLAAGDALGAEGLSVVTLDQQAVGRLSRMDALQNQAMSKATQARRDLEVTRLTAALARMDEGDYGWCEDCGDAIPLKRLELDPAAIRCVSCASG